MEEPGRRYILVHDRAGHVIERNMLALGLSTKSTPTQVLKGELLEALPEGKQPEDLTRIALSGIFDRKSLRLECRTEDVALLSSEDADLLLAISSVGLRYETFIDRKQLDFGRRLLPGSQVFVNSVKGISKSLPGVVWYKGNLPYTLGTMFGVELVEHPGLGTSDGTFGNKKYFDCAPNCGVFVGLDKLTPRDDSESKSPKKGEGSQTTIASRILESVMPSFFKGKNKPNLSLGSMENRLKIDQRVVTVLAGEQPVRGVVRYIGKDKDRNGKMQTIVGLELDTMIGNGTGKLHGKQVFVCQRNYAVFLPIEAVILEEDFDGNARKVAMEGTSQEESLPRHLQGTEQELHSLQEQLREKEEREANLIRQLRQTEEQKENIQKELVRTEQGLRDYQEQLQEKETREAMLHEQLKVREEQKQNLERHLREAEQQLTICQGQLQEKDLTEASLHEQLREKEEEEENSQRQLREMEQRLTNCEEQIREKEEERAHLEQQVTPLERQLRAKDEELNELELSLSTAQQTINEQRRQEICDWVIPRNEIQMTDKCLGRGGWGSVNEGTYCGCTIAVKQIHELILSPHNRRLFEREMNIASRCRHPCLLQFIGATNDEGSPLFVTELMETSLRALLEERHLSESEISVISLDVSRALNYLHQKTIVHRDVSSANVLLWRQGDQWRGKVSDYGTAKFMQQTMTVAPGALIYSAPEALTSNQTDKVDVYSFGVLLCEMYIRELPEPERREEQVALMTNRTFRGLVRRCLQTDPAQRPNMGEIIQNLEQLLPT